MEDRILVVQNKTPISHSTEFPRVHYAMKQRKEPNDNGRANGENVLRQL